MLQFKGRPAQPQPTHLLFLNGLKLFIHIVVLAWIYVVLMMAVAEGMSSQGTVLGAVFTFLLYGALPIALVVYVMATPARKRARRAREVEQEAREAHDKAARAAASEHASAADPDQIDTQASTAPDQRSETSAGRAVTAEREKL